MTRFLFSLSFTLCSVAALVTASSLRAEEALPSQDQALARALENHPDIVAAKAKVTLAEAELYGKRMNVSRQVLGLYGSLKHLDACIDVAKVALTRSKAELERTRQLAAGGQADQTTAEKATAAVETAEAELVQAIGQREQAEKELRLAIGNPLRPAATNSSTKDPLAPRQAPQGAIVEKMKPALEKSIQLDFTEMPLVEVASFLSDTTGITFSLQPYALEDAGIARDMPITILTDKVPLRAALQAFQDAYPDLQFFVRDYGILVTTPYYAEERGYTPVLE